jgi:hypothetical protein
MARIYRLAAIASAAVGLLPVVSHSSRWADEIHTMSATPHLILWAWERPEDLRFVDSEHVGVAFLAGTVSLRANRTDFRPRMQPLRVSPQTRLMSVIRIETNPNAELNQEQLRATANAIARASTLPQVVATQIDFDATVSERVFYHDLLLELRRQLPSSMPISITALASWCIGDDWIAGFPIDEAVPMLFRLGVGQNEVSTWIRSQRGFREPLCRSSLGVSTDEPWESLSLGRRVYAFSPQPWTERSVEALSWEMHAWR